MRNKAFTLIEIVVVIAILGIVGLVSTSLFFRNIRSTNRSDSTSEVSQNAQAVLTSIDRFVRNARKVTSVCPATSATVSLQASDDLEVVFSLENGRVASNGAYLTSPSITVENLQFVCERTEGLPDSITVSFDVTHNTTAEDAETTESFTQTTNLRNFE